MGGGLSRVVVFVLIAGFALCVVAAIGAALYFLARKGARDGVRDAQRALPNSGGR